MNIPFVKNKDIRVRVYNDEQNFEGDTLVRKGKEYQTKKTGLVIGSFDRSALVRDENGDYFLSVFSPDGKRVVIIKPQFTKSTGEEEEIEEYQVIKDKKGKILKKKDGTPRTKKVKKKVKKIISAYDFLIPNVTGVAKSKIDGISDEIFLKKFLDKHAKEIFFFLSVFFVFLIVTNLNNKIGEIGTTLEGVRGAVNYLAHVMNQTGYAPIQ